MDREQQQDAVGVPPGGVQKRVMAIRGSIMSNNDI
jgi:hypothetical protein